MSNHKQFLADLVAIMKKNDIRFIGWSCGDGSDTHGIYNSEISLTTTDGREIGLSSDCLSVRDIEDLIND